MLHRLIPVRLALILPIAAAASALDERHLGAEPVGPVILTVSGNIDGIGAGTAVRLDRAMLEEIGTTKLKTSTAWTTGMSSATISATGRKARSAPTISASRSRA